MKKVLLINANELVTCSGFSAKKGKAMQDLGILEQGAVYMEDGVIREIGTTEELSGKYMADDCHIIDAEGKAVLPGFVDSHTHFVFGGYRADEFNWRLRGDSYLSIMERGGGIINTVRDTRAASKETLLELGRKRLRSMLSFGVTTVEGKSGYGLELETEMKQLDVMAALEKLQPIEIVKTYLGAHAVPPEYKDGGEDRYIDEMIAVSLPYVAEHKAAEFCDIFVEKNVFSVEQGRRLLHAAKQLGFQLKIHADEMAPLGGAELAAEVGAISADHLLQASERGIAAMAAAGTVATLLPCTAFSLKENYARGRDMIDQGCAVALASDFNPGSCFTESIALVFILATLHMGLTVEEAVTALTINGAAAVGRADRIGSIDVGKQADLVILEYPSYRYIPYHLGVSTVERVVKKGILVYDNRGQES